MRSRKQLLRRHKERGIAMMIAMLSIVLLAIVGMAFLFMANTENAVNSNFKSSQKAYFASRGGLEDVRVLLQQGGTLYTQASAMTMPKSGATSGVIYVFNGASDPTSHSGNTVASNFGLDDELCHEQFTGMTAVLSPGVSGVPCGSGPGGPASELMPNQGYYSVPSPAVTTAQTPFTWVRITNKQNYMGLTGQLVNAGDVNQGDQVCWDGTHEIAVTPGTCPTANPSQPMTPVLVLTSLSATPAFGNNPGSRRMTQMEVAYMPPIFAPGTISTQAPVTLQGQYSLQSYDNCSCVSTTDKNGNTTWGPRPGFATCNQNAHTIYTAGEISVNGSSGQVLSNWGNTATSSSVQNVNPWPYDINALITQFESQALNAATTAPWNYSCPGTANFTATPPQYASCGTQTNQVYGTFPPKLLSSGGSDPSGSVPAIVYVPGSVKLTSDANGAGILIVDGDLELNGGLNFYGLILVRGRVSFTGGGSQAVNLYGAVLAGEDVSATDQSLTDTFGGSINLKYDRCALSGTPPAGPPNLLAAHEVMY